MKNYKTHFIEFSLKMHCLKFGNFTLKSGRKSPYFFNIASIHHSTAIAELGKFYAAVIMENFTFGKDYDVIFGPAYKGIPLVVTTAIALASEYQLDVPFSFNRKEAKDHGEGGIIVGSPLHGKVLVLDDVITAGTAINEAAHIIKKSHAAISGIIIALDRQEIGNHGESAVKEVEDKHKAPVKSIINLNQLIHYLKDNEAHQTDLHNAYDHMLDYRKRFGNRESFED